MDEIIYIRALYMPPKVHAVTVIDSDGGFNIYINTLLAEDRQETAWEHELRHIKKNHFYDFNPVIINELEAEKIFN